MNALAHKALSACPTEISETENPMQTEERRHNSFLSKSQFIRGLQCHKSLYLHKHHPELRGEISAGQEAVFQSGTDVGKLAQQLFPGGVEIPYDGLTISEQVEQTAEAIAAGTETIYEASFGHDGIFVKVDILYKGAHGWELYEVKGSTVAKKVHVHDAALQYHVLNGAGINLAKAAIVHVNNGYTRHGELDITSLFSIEDVTLQVQELQEFVAREIARQRESLQAGMPAIDIGRYCSEPYRCDFSSHCWSHIPEDSVFDLRGRGADKFKLYRQGVLTQADIPLDTLNALQRFQVDATLGQKDSVDVDRVRKFLASLWYPLYFLDSETFTSAIPLFDGSRPYQQIPFQYSLHYQETELGELKHYEFLAQPGIDPREELLCGLLEQIPENACILAYNKSFEIGVLRRLAEFFPAKRKQIECMIGNFRDLMAPFKSRAVYKWQMKGSYSIKEVLPALVPELTYKGLEINTGGMAMEAYHEMGRMEKPQELEKIRMALLEYCKLDTLAMVRILEKMLELCS